MSKRQVLLLLGIWVMIFLFLSFRPEWDKIFSLITGFMIIFIAFKLPPEIKSRDHVTHIESKKEAPRTRIETPTKMSDMKMPDQNIINDSEVSS
ncbi:MAG: hypothetical protein M3Q80_01570 [bacterium]|nr:hypothetical protein [bacterium]